MSSVETQFHVPPFPPFPSAERYVRVGSQDDALQRVCRAVEAFEAISLVIGPPGTGKSLICQVLQKHFSRDREVIVFGDATLESPQSLQRHLLNRLDRIRGIAPTPPAIGDDPQLAIIERIAGSSKEFAGLLLLVDEAQTLRPEVLETIRILTNVMSDGRPRVSAVLLGGPKLDETLALPSLDSLVQRVSTRCYVHPLSSDETVHYVREIAEKCCRSLPINIEETAIRSIHRACSGVPRLVNQLMTATIGFAMDRKQDLITTHTVDRAWAVLQQLPGPLVDEPQLERPQSDVEFGPLGVDDHSFRDQDDVCESEDCGNGDGSGESSVSEITARDITAREITVEEPVAESTVESTVESIVEALVESIVEESTILELTVRSEIEITCNDVSSFDASQYEAAQYEAAQFDTAQFDTAQFDNAQLDTAQLGGGSFDCAVTESFEYDDCSTSEATNRETALTPTSGELFGEFEEEEPVCEMPERHLESNESLDRHPAVDDNDDTEPVDIESSLHREILSLRGATIAPVLWMEDGECDEPVHDDRDLLVIEDDVELEEAIVVGQATTDEPAGIPMAVDFQSMLAKMRTPQR